MGLHIKSLTDNKVIVEVSVHKVLRAPMRVTLDLEMWESADYLLDLEETLQSLHATLSSLKSSTHAAQQEATKTKSYYDSTTVPYTYGSSVPTSGK